MASAHRRAGSVGARSLRALRGSFGPRIAGKLRGDRSSRGLRRDPGAYARENFLMSDRVFSRGCTFENFFLEQGSRSDLLFRAFGSKAVVSVWRSPTVGEPEHVPSEPRCSIRLLLDDALFHPCRKRQLYVLSHRDRRTEDGCHGGSSGLSTVIVRGCGRGKSHEVHAFEMPAGAFV